MSRVMENPISRRSGDRSFLRRRNCLSVLKTLWRGPATIAEVARSTSLSRTAAEAVLADLVATGWIIDTGPPLVPSLTPGRPASVFHFAPNAGHVGGVDIGAHHVSACVASLAGTKVSTVHLFADEQMPAKERLDLAGRALEGALFECGLVADDLWAVTVGSPGVIDRGKVIHFGGSGMPGWIGLDIAQHFTNMLKGVVLVEGDSALGAVAESTHGAGIGVSHLVYILSGIRTGAAIITNGAVLRGHRGGAGLIGELPELRWRDIEHTIYDRSYSDNDATVRQNTFTRARRGDAASVATILEFADALAVGAAAMVLAIDPEVLIIGGPNAQHADIFLERFTTGIVARCPVVPDIRVSRLGPDAVLTGSITFGLESIVSALESFVESGTTFPSPTRDIVRILVDHLAPPHR